MNCTGQHCLGEGSTDFPLTANDSLKNISTTPVPYDRDENLARWEIFVSALIFVIALVGNSIVVHSLWRRRKKLTRMHFFILHLCIADLLTAALSILSQMIWDITFLFYAPDAVCRLVKYGQMFPMYLSAYILVMTAIDRYIAICHPLQGLTEDYKQRMRIMIAVAYVTSFVFAVPQLAFFTNVPVTGGFSCQGHFTLASGRAYTTFITIAVYVVPSLILGIAYGLISYTVWRNMGNTPHAEKKKYNNSSSTTVTTTLDEEDGDRDGIEMKVAKASTEREDPLCRKHGSVARVSRAKVKTIKMTLTIVTVYIACWTPFFLAQVWSAWHPWSAPFESVSFVIIMLLANINSCTNPLIYLAFSSNVKRDTLRTFGCFKFGLRDKYRSPYTNDRAPMEDNVSRYASTTSNAVSKTLYSSVESAREGNGHGNNHYYSPKPAVAHARDI